MLVICPPELQPFDRNRYFSDLNYRVECDEELIGERYERLRLLFHKHLDAK